MKRFFITATVLLSIFACTKSLDDIEPNDSTDQSNSLVFSKSYNICIPSQVLDKRKVDGYTFEVHSPEVKASDVVDLYLEVFPMFAFGDTYASGDYYCVEGYLLSRNALLYGERADRDVKICGWYPSEYNLEFEMFSPEGVSLNENEAEFLVHPEPSTSITSTTYKKGTTFTLEAKVTIGVAKKEKLSDALSWMNSLMGVVSFGYKHENSSTQNLPDQTVLLKTDSKTHRVNYSFISNNDTGGYTTKDIPLIFRYDQYIHFSWVWHLKQGYYCAKNNDFGNMKMKVTIKPKYKTAYNGKIVDTHGRAIFKGWSEYQHEAMTEVFDMPAMNRIPSGTVKLKYVSSDDSGYLKGLKVYRSGEYSEEKEPYYSDPKAYTRNQIVSMELREGTYDFVFSIKSRNSDLKCKLSDVKVTGDTVTETSTLSATVL